MGLVVNRGNVFLFSDSMTVYIFTILMGYYKKLYPPREQSGPEWKVGGHKCQSNGSKDPCSLSMRSLCMFVDRSLHLVLDRPNNPSTSPSCYKVRCCNSLQSDKERGSGKDYPSQVIFT